MTRDTTMATLAFRICSRLLKVVLGTDELPPSEHLLEDVEAYPWHVDTKYYTADILLCTTPTRTIGDKPFADSVHAIVLFFDSQRTKSFEMVESWLPYLKELEPQVQLLVCDSCSHTDAVSRDKVQRWCLDHAFELVELHPPESSDSEDDDFQETTGIKRVVQALHAHTWSNLVMKENPSVHSPYMQELRASAAAGRQKELAAERENNLDTAAKKVLPPNTDSSVNAVKQAILNVDTDNTDSSMSNTHAHGDTLNDSKLNGTDLSLKELATADIEKDEDTSQCPHQTADGASSINSRETSELVGATCQESSLGAEGLLAMGMSSKDKLEKDKKDKENKQKSKTTMIDNLIGSEDMSLFSALGNDDPGDESFEQLFARMKTMKEKAESLPPDQRKAYAEQVAISFWKAIGGDEDEIDGLSDEEDIK